jgi:hypothetical protein
MLKEDNVTTDAAASDQLLPCPFCGGKAAFRWCGGILLAECTACGTSKGDTGGDGDAEIKASAAAAWNARAPAPDLSVTLDARTRGIKAIATHWREFGPDHGFDEVVETVAYAVELGERATGASQDTPSR